MSSNYGVNVVNITNSKGESVSYFLEPWIKKKFDETIKPDLTKNDKDCIIAIDGREGSGKSWLAMQLAKYIDPDFDLSRVCFTPEEFREAVYKAKPRQSIVYDEAFTGFSSRAALSGVNRTLISLMMQIRQKNLFIVIVLPTVFLLDKYISLFRTRALVHVYEVMGRRGFYRVYLRRKKKDLIMHKDARTYNYGIKTKNKGRFYGTFALGGEEIEKKYRLKKQKALELSAKDPINIGQVKYREQRDIMVYVLRKTLKMSYKKIALLLNDYDFEMSFAQIRNICAKFGDKEINEEDLEQENIDLEQNEPLKT